MSNAMKVRAYLHSVPHSTLEDIIAAVGHEISPENAIWHWERMSGNTGVKTSKPERVPRGRRLIIRDILKSLRQTGYVNKEDIFFALTAKGEQFYLKEATSIAQMIQQLITKIQQPNFKVASVNGHIETLHQALHDLAST